MNQSSLLDRSGLVDRIVELVVLSSNSEEIDLVENGDPFKNGGGAALVVDGHVPDEETSSDHEAPSMIIDAGNISLLALRQFRSGGVQLVAEEETIEHKSDEVGASNIAVNLSPHRLVEDANERKAQARNDTKTQGNIVKEGSTTLGIIDFLEESAHIGKLNSEHEHSHHEDEQTSVHLLVDNV